MITIRKLSGFTIVELVLVIVLLGIMSAVTLTRFFDVQIFSSRFTFNDIESALSYSHTTAITSGCAVQFSLDAGNYQLLTDTSCDSTSPDFSTPVIHPDSGNTFNGTLPNGFNLITPGTPLILVFTPQSTIEDNTGTELAVLDLTFSGNNISDTIRLHGSTGFVE